jgi:hypothetical protein
MNTTADYVIIHRFRANREGAQRRAFGLRNEEYLRLKVLTCVLPKL